MADAGRLVRIDDTSLHVVTRGDGPLPLLVLHGGPGFDHVEFADYLDPLGDLCTLLLVDQRAQGRSARDTAPFTWTLERMAQDVTMLALALGLSRYAVFGHSYGAFVSLQHAIDHPGHPAASIVCCGVPATRFLEVTPEHLARVEPAERRERFERAFADEASVETPEQMWRMFVESAPFYFADLDDPRIAEYIEKISDSVFAPEVTRGAAQEGYRIELEERLDEIPTPLLALGGRHDRVCPPEASEAIAAGVPGARLRIFERSGHFPFVEEPEAFLEVVRDFLGPIARASG
ncbi:MAG: alpha/beta fold hydrolase [Actinomycetota bacterium]